MYIHKRNAASTVRMIQAFLEKAESCDFKLHTANNRDSTMQKAKWAGGYLEPKISLGSDRGYPMICLVCQHNGVGRQQEATFGFSFSTRAQVCPKPDRRINYIVPSVEVSGDVLTIKATDYRGHFFTLEVKRVRKSQ